jgi:uncharacterized protein YciI
LTYTNPLEEVDKYLDEHISYLKQEYANVNFIASGRKIPRTRGIILSTVETKNELESILKKDPFYQKEIAKYEITEFIPTMTAGGFEILKSQ